MKYVISDQVVLSRPPKGPLVPYVAAFSTWVAGQGYALESVRQRVRMAADFSRWLADKSVRLRAVTSEHCAQYLRYRARRQRICDCDASALRQLLDFLRAQGAVPAEKARRPRLTSAERCARAFELYLREERLLAEATIVNYVPLSASFSGIVSVPDLSSSPACAPGM